MSNSRFGVIVALSVTIIPTIGYCLADKPKRKANPPSVARTDRPEVAPAMDEGVKEGWAMWRSLSNRGMAEEGYFGGVRPANNQPICVNVVTNVAGDEGVAPTGNYWMQVSYDWICRTATQQSPCKTVATVTVFNAAGEWQVFHDDASPLACGDNTYQIDTWSLNVNFQQPPNGHYTATIDIYGGTWATWTPSTPILGTGSFSFNVAH